MMMKLKMIAGLLALCGFTALLTGCDDDDDANNPAAPANNGNPGGGGNTTTNTGPATPTAAPARLSQIVLNGNPGNPAGSGQTVINISGATFTYAAGGYNGGVLYTPSGTSARLRLTYSGSATGDVDDYTLQFMAPSGSSTPSTFSGTQKVGANPAAPASGTFTYTQ